MSAPRKALVIGSPIAHARSPLLHQYWLKELGIAGSYAREEVKPDEVAEFLRALPSRGIAGCNVTVPDKEAAFAACDRVTTRARIVGAVNTIWFEDGKLWGDNTDGFGFAAHLDQTWPGWDKAKPRILILGAGGAARGIIGTLVERDPREIIIANRSPGRAEQLIRDITAIHPRAAMRAIHWDDLGAAMPKTGLLINTTSLGMKGQPVLDIDLAALPGDAIVADIVYVPLETELLAKARARGHRVLDGLGMLLHQAVPGFERWFGQRPVVSEGLRARLIADLEGRD